ncbi:hypothetical protein ACH35V_38270 [Actinomadura sp. 1N219]|uniref:hypothetical protein n=1 Tax=Actinomadura sp. 1N219 TaxID=3375152 RepID=UPI0037A52803
MADSTVLGDAPLIIRTLRGRAGTQGCIGPKILAWVLAALFAVAAAGVLASFFPRGGHRRGTRRIRRQRPWHRVWDEAPARRRDDEAEERRV